MAVEAETTQVDRFLGAIRAEWLRSAAARFILAVAAGLLPRLALSQVTTNSAFYMGADISLQSFMQQQSVTFTDSGVPKTVDQLLYDRGANLFRLRIFVDPQTTYTNTNSGAIQSLSYDIALAQQIKANAPGAKLLLDFHYSDTWADPGHQAKPAAWAGQTLSQLRTTIQNYTQNALLAFKNAGVMPEMVQLGNEISSGMLFTTGQLNFSGSTAQQQTSWQNLGSLLNSAIQGVRTAQGAGPPVQIAIHIDQGDQDGHPQYYFGNLTSPAWGNVSDFNTIGVSYYPSTRASHSFQLLQSNLTAIANTYPTKKIMVLETDYPWRTSTLAVPQWPATPAGQQQFLIDLRNMLLGLPNDAGEGLVYWYPEAVQTSGYTIYNGGSTALFDDSAAHNVLPSASAFLVVGRGDFNADGHFTAADLPAMLTALTDLQTYKSAHNFSAADLLNIGDFNGDLVVSNKDLQMMLDAFSLAGMGSTAAVPEPTNAILACLGFVAFIAHSARRLIQPKNGCLNDEKSLFADA
jgi:arabinogalactan endo-1,4-beta-galactosidase